MSGLELRDVTVRYGDTTALDGVSMAVAPGEVVALLGPSGSGKSTLLRGLSRLLKPTKGQVVLDGADIHSYKAKDVAKRIGLLPQSSIAPEGIRVADLVARGRHPHQKLFQQWTEADEKAVLEAMDATGVTPLSGRLVDELSGGQRQRVWIAMALAQQTDILLLDEPTTYLDITYQIELLELFTDLNLAGHTLVAVLHDLNHAARYATHLIAMRGGKVMAEGAPTDIVTAELVEEVFGLKCVVVPDPIVGTPQVVPVGRNRARV